MRPQSVKHTNSYTPALNYESSMNRQPSNRVKETKQGWFPNRPTSEINWEQRRTQRWHFNNKREASSPPSKPNPSIHSRSREIFFTMRGKKYAVREESDSQPTQCKAQEYAGMWVWFYSASSLKWNRDQHLVQMGKWGKKQPERLSELWTPKKAMCMRRCAQAVWHKVLYRTNYNWAPEFYTISRTHSLIVTAINFSGVPSSEH